MGPPRSYFVSKLAERVGFEPTIPSRVYRFSSSIAVVPHRHIVSGGVTSCKFTGNLYVFAVMSCPVRWSVVCRQNIVAGSDTNSEDAWLLKQLPHGLAGYLPSSPAPHTLPYLALFDGEFPISLTIAYKSPLNPAILNLEIASHFEIAAGDPFPVWRGFCALKSHPTCISDHCGTQHGTTD